MGMRSAGLAAALIALAGCAGNSGKAPPKGPATAGENPPARNEGPAQTPASPEPVAAAPSNPVEASPPPVGADPSWWIEGAKREDGRVRIAAKADGDAMIDARRAAVQSGTDALRTELKADPQDVQTEKVDLAHLDDGRWRVFVLMSCKE